MTRRLHTRCPACGSTEALRPDGCVVQHTALDRLRRSRVCTGSGTRPAPEDVRAWLDRHEAEARATVDRAQAALTRAQEQLAAAQTECEARAAWCARERGRL